MASLGNHKLLISGNPMMEQPALSADDPDLEKRSSQSVIWRGA